MEKIFSKLEGPLMKIGDKINGIIFFSVLRDAFMLAFPVVIFGSLITIVSYFPFLDAIIGAEAAQNWAKILAPATNASMNIMSIFVAAGIGYYYSKAKGVQGIFGAVVCISGFFVLFPWTSGFVTDGSTEALTAIDTTVEKASTFAPIVWIGAKGMFVAIIFSFILSGIYCFVTKKNIVIKMPPQVPPSVANSFTALIPATCALVFALLVSITFQFLPWGDVFTFVFSCVQAPLTSLGTGAVATIASIFFIQFFWFFGLHGQVIVNSMMDPIWNTTMAENFANYTSGQPLTNIVTRPFIDAFCTSLGGSGSTLIVVIFLVLFVRSRQLKDLGKIALPAGVFNVNEPLIFGLPIIFNPLVLIPWIVAPMVSVAIAYFAMDWGIVPMTTGISVPFTVPIFISGFLATNSIMGSLLQLVQMIVVGLIWFPFIKILDKRMRAAETKDVGEEKAPPDDGGTKHSESGALVDGAENSRPPDKSGS